MMDCDIIEIIQKIIAFIKLDNTNLKVKEFPKIDQGEIEYMFQKENDVYLILKIYHVLTKTWIYKVFKNNKIMTVDDILLLYANLDLNYKIMTDDLK